MLNVSRRVVGWSDATHTPTRLIVYAVDMATEPDDHPETSSIIRVTATPSTSTEPGRRRHRAGIGPSMGSVGAGYDNSMTESFLRDPLRCFGVGVLGRLGDVFEHDLGRGHRRLELEPRCFAWWRPRRGKHHFSTDHCLLLGVEPRLRERELPGLSRSGPGAMCSPVRTAQGSHWCSSQACRHPSPWPDPLVEMSGTLSRRSHHVHAQAQLSTRSCQPAAMWSSHHRGALSMRFDMLE